jgi:hypothetical protein
MSTRSNVSGFRRHRDPTATTANTSLVRRKLQARGIPQPRGNDWLHPGGTRKSAGNGIEEPPRIPIQQQTQVSQICCCMRSLLRGRSNSLASIYPFNRYLLSKEMGYQPIHVKTNLMHMRHHVFVFAILPKNAATNVRSLKLNHCESQESNGHESR